MESGSGNKQAISTPWRQFALQLCHERGQGRVALLITGDMGTNVQEAQYASILNAEHNQTSRWLQVLETMARDEKEPVPWDVDVEEGRIYPTTLD